MRYTGQDEGKSYELFEKKTRSCIFLLFHSIQNFDDFGMKVSPLNQTENIYKTLNLKYHLRKNLENIAVSKDLLYLQL